MKKINKKLLHEALQLRSTNDAYSFSQGLSDQDIEELIRLVEILNKALNIIFRDNIRWTLVFQIQFINEVIQFKQGKLNPPEKQ